MNHAFLITAHKYPEQLGEIIRILDAPNHYFFIHIDKKNYRKMIESKEIQRLGMQSNCIIIHCITVNWGGYSQILTSLRLMEETIQSKINFSFYHLISGQDFPLVDNKTFDDFFERHKEYSFIEIDNRSYADRYELYHLNDVINVVSFNKIKRLLVKIQRPINRFVKLRQPIGLKVYKGSNWWSINKSMFECIRQFLQNHKSYIDRFRYTYCCDEIFFHTIMLNSSLKDCIITNNLRYVDWKPKHKEDSLPRVLDETDYESIIRTQSLFCRKIDPVISNKLKIKILRRIKGM